MPAQALFGLRIGRVALAGFVLSLPASAFATSPPRPSEPLYPTDRCVARKLAAAADACQDLILAQGERNPRKFAERVTDVANDLAHVWQKAEADSLATGVDCVQTTVTSAQMATLLEDGAKGLAVSSEAARPLAPSSSSVAICALVTVVCTQSTPVANESASAFCQTCARSLATSVTRSANLRGLRSPWARIRSWHASAAAASLRATHRSVG